MKILYVGSPQLFTEGASGIHVGRMCEALSDLGHDTTLMLPIEEEEIGGFFSFYGVKDNFLIKATPGFKKSSMRHFFHGIISFLKFLFSKDYDLVLTRNITFALLASFIKSRIIVDIHHPPVNLLSKIATKRFLKCENIVRVSCNSVGTMDSIVKIFSHNEKLKVFHNGVNLESFVPNDNLDNLVSKLNIPDKCKIISYVGNTYKGRGIEKIIELSKKHKEIFFLVVGGEQEDNSYYLKSVDSTQSNILFTGHVPHEEIPNYLCISDILLIPYDSDFTIKGGSLAKDYSSPIKLFEYLSAGKPIVASNLSSFNEILKDGMNSILVNPDSISEISESIQKLLNDKALSDNLSSNSLELSKRFTWINRAKGMISL